MSDLSLWPRGNLKPGRLQESFNFARPGVKAAQARTTVQSRSLQLFGAILVWWPGEISEKNPP
jgi:hypothetical protein